ncbi:MAG: hypothetical protein ACP5OG_02700, partial [Candidatus Nanoarchaeia archaeon]
MELEKKVNAENQGNNFKSCDRISFCVLYKHVLPQMQVEYCRSKKYLDCAHRQGINKRKYIE